MWDELARGALGAVVLADTRRLADCFPSVDYFERRAIPFVVAVNCFEGARRYRSKDVRTALDLDPDVPVSLCDARHSTSGRDVLVSLVEHALVMMSGHRSAPAVPAPSPPQPRSSGRKPSAGRKPSGGRRPRSGRHEACRPHPPRVPGTGSTTRCPGWTCCGPGTSRTATPGIRTRRSRSA